MKTKFIVFACLLFVACGKRPVVTSEAGAVAAVERLLAGRLSESELRQLRPFKGGITGGSENPGFWLLWSANGKKMFSVEKSGVVGEWEVAPGDTLTFSIPQKGPNKAPEPTTMSVTPPAAQESRRP